ncbi:hypothetical protein FA809_23080 [Salmonella enterica]|nr:hypothetical protein [Salmonella enterica]
MGLFGGVSQADYDALKRDFGLVRFRLSCEEMKSGAFSIFADMCVKTGHATGLLDAVMSLIDANMKETARILYLEVRDQIADDLRKSNLLNQEIISVVDGLGDAKQAFLNHLSNDERSLTDRVNDLNNLNQLTWNLIRSTDQMFGIGE